MANRISKQPVSVRPRKGKSGNVRLAIDVEPHVRWSLVGLAGQRHTTLSALCRQALDRYLRQELCD